MGAQATDLNKIYRSLQRHLDGQAVGFPATRSGADIRLLRHLFTPEEAAVALCLSFRPAPQDRIIAGAAKSFSAEKTVALLESAFRKGAIGWKMRDNAPHWYVIPLVIGIYEAQDGNPSPEFLAVAGEFTKTMNYGRSFLSVKPSQMRTIPIGRSVTVDHSIATYDEIRSLILSSGGPFVILKCICREEQRIKGHACRQTSRLETCLGMGDMAAMTLRRNHGREITADEALDFLRQNEEDGLVLQPANERKAEFVCSCCGCCCGMLRFQKMLPNPVDFWSGNYYSTVNADSCIHCSLCVKRCQVNALECTPPGAARVNKNRCIGCGLCVPTCPKKAISLIKKPVETVPPENEEALLEAINANKTRGLGQWMAMAGRLAGRGRRSAGNG
jgi:Pyruvate/2-oxoacid:ferredoxin oxidoreductase delta subunit